MGEGGVILGREWAIEQSKHLVRKMRSRTSGRRERESTI